MNRAARWIDSIGLRLGLSWRFFFDEHLHLASISSGLAVSCTKYNVETRYNHPASPARDLLHPQHDRNQRNSITSVVRTRPFPPKLQLHPHLDRDQKPNKQQHHPPRADRSPSADRLRLAALKHPSCQLSPFCVTASLLSSSRAYWSLTGTVVSLHGRRGGSCRVVSWRVV